MGPDHFLGRQGLYCSRSCGAEGNEHQTPGQFHRQVRQHVRSLHMDIPRAALVCVQMGLRFGSQAHRESSFADGTFVKEETLPLYLGAVRNFSLANTKCGFEEDRRVLEAKINEAYVSKDHFEVLVQATVIALMARSMAFRAGRSPKLYETYYQPWVTLARDLGMNDLANALGSCDCLTWRRVSSISSSNCGAMRRTSSSLSANSTTETKDIVSPSSDRSQVVTPECHYDLMQMSIGVNSLAFHEVISDWFEIDVVPILAKFQETSTK